MAYARSKTLDPNPGGTTRKQAIVDLDTDLKLAFTDLNLHEALTVSAHGVTVGMGAIASTEGFETIKNKVLSSPTLTGTVVASGATISSPTITGGTISNPTITNAEINNSTISSLTITGAIVASGATISSPTITGATITSSSLNGLTLTPTTTGFTIAGGTASRTITVDETVSLSSKMNKTGSNLAIGSDADGDIYYRASGVLARLPKGTTLQVLRINAGETAPEWATISSGAAETTWTDYGGTSTIVGWSSFITGRKQIYYKKIGNICFISFYIDGTSNSTSTTFTLPYTAYNSGYGDVSGGALIFTYDNSTAKTTPGRWVITQNSNIVTCYTDMGTGSWTASNGKIVNGCGFFEIKP